MQRFLYIIFFSALIAGCNDNSATTLTDSRKDRKEKSSNDPEFQAGELDTLGLAEFMAIKAARFRESNMVDGNISITENEIALDTSGWAEYKRTTAKIAPHDFESPTPREKIRIESNKPNDSQISTPRKKGTAVRQDVSKVEKKSSDNSEVTQVPARPTKEKKDVNKSVSKKTKGAIIGAATGAAAGAVINKRNRKAGAVLGGIIGAATGYGIGRHKDKKDTSAKGEKQTTDN